MIIPGAAALASLAALPVGAQPTGPSLGPDAARCTSGAGPAFLVQVIGLKNRRGTVRVRLFGGSPDSYFVRERALVRTQIPTPATGPVQICVPAPAAGTYALDVRHDVNGDDRSDLSDGGGTSGNPRLSLWSLLTHRRPDVDKVQVRIGNEVRVVPITLLYVRGGRLVPAGEP